jgi:superfamily II DNA or RNA helicase
MGDGMSRRLTSKRLRAALWIAANGNCQICKIGLPDDWHADHVIPWSKSGITNVHDMQALCPACNLKKGASMFEFREHQQKLLESIQDSRINHQIVAHVCPGGGKSVLPVIAANGLIRKGLVERVAIFVPRLSLKRQGAQAFLDPSFRNALGHNLTIRETDGGAEPNPCKGTNGFVTTYQSVSGNSSFFEHYCRKYKTLVVFDEAHHIGEGSATHKDLAGIYRLAAYRLIMTGTLDRNNGDKIAFLEYSKPDLAANLKPDVDIYYGLGDALREKAIIPIHFFFADGPVRYVNKDSQHVHLTSLAESGEDARDGLSAALETDFAFQLLDSCLRDWMSWRIRNPRSLMLVVCKDINQANKMKDRLVDSGVKCGIATSDDSESAQQTIQSYRSSGSPQVLVTVAMAYEGLDVRAITHIACLTHYRSKSWLIQMFNRATRSDPEAGPWNKQRAFIYVPNDPLINEVIQFMRDEGIVGVDEPEDDGGANLCGGDNLEITESGHLIPVDGRVSTITAETFDGEAIRLSDNQRRKLEEIKFNNNFDLTVLDMAKVIRASGYEIPSAEDNLPAASLPDPTPKQEEDFYRKRINSLCSRLDNKQKVPHGTWNRNMVFRHRKSRTEMTVSELQQLWKELNVIDRNMVETRS